MPDAAAWEAFAGLGGVLIFLGGVAFALRRLGILRPPQGAAPAAAPAETPGGDDECADLRRRMRELERGLADLRLHCAETYLSRHDYVTTQSRIIGLLESHSVLLARLEERIEALKQ